MSATPIGSLRLKPSPACFLALLALGLAVFPAVFIAQARAGELQPDRRAELILGMGPNQGEDPGVQSDLQGQLRWGPVFLGAEAFAGSYFTPILPNPVDSRALYQNRGVTGWIGGHHGAFNLAVRFTQITEEWFGPWDGSVNNENDNLVKSWIYDDHVENERTGHWGMALGWTLAPGHRVGVLGDWGRQVRARYDRVFLRALVSAEAGMHRIEYDPFREPVWYTAQLSVRFSPLGRPLATSHFHVIVGLGVHLFDFPADSRWNSSDTPFPAVFLKLAGVF
ncbi:hypothetical protein KJ612_00500 [Myxococcota bacterium]|nr:hypothetical protein [Myxococcota bacterium]MBU1410412.1 hypothetical protein [Myxococcota bacterium]